MRRGRFLILLSLLLVLSAAGIFLVFLIPGVHAYGNPGYLTCYSTGGDTVIFKDHVTSALVGTGGVWYVNNNTVKITGDCVFVEDK